MAIAILAQLWKHHPVRFLSDNRPVNELQDPLVRTVLSQFPNSQMAVGNLRPVLNTFTKQLQDTTASIIYEPSASQCW